MSKHVPLLYLFIASLLPTGRDDSEPSLANDDRGQLRTGAIVGVLLSVIGLLLVAFILSGTADPFFNATENLTNSVETATTGNSTIDTLMGPFGILVAAVLTIAFIGKILDFT